MAVSEKQKGYQKKYDDANMAYQTIKVRKTLLADFKAACAERGDRVNTVLRQAMEEYIAKEGRE
jgi:uncharacterized protein (DUF4415 family)